MLKNKGAATESRVEDLEEGQSRKGCLTSLRGLRALSSSSCTDFALTIVSQHDF